MSRGNTSSHRYCHKCTAKHSSWFVQTYLPFTWPLLVMDELIGLICFKLRACSLGWNNSSIHLFTKSGHEPRFESEKRKKSGPEMPHCGPDFEGNWFKQQRPRCLDSPPLVNRLPHWSECIDYTLKGSGPTISSLPSPISCLLETATRCVVPSSSTACIS